MLRSTLRKLAKGRGAAPRRSPRASTRRPSLEALEDRLVLSAATQFGSTPLIAADPGGADHARPAPPRAADRANGRRTLRMAQRSPPPAGADADDVWRSL
jgi:hypothetical protein